MLVTMALIPPLIRVAERWQFVDMPNERKVHLRAIPRVGGVAMVVGAVLPLILWLWSSPQVIALLAGMGVIVVFGVWDDRADLDYRLKFAGQFLAALIVWGAGVRVGYLPWIAQLAPLWSLGVTVLALLAITNAVNLADGLDGLAGGSTLLSLTAIAVLGYMAGQVAVVLIALAVMGSILGFLRFNTHPARVFMGDGGSQFLGFATGVLAIFLTQWPDSPYSLSLPVLLLGLPILDTALVMVQRLRQGRSPFSPDKNHIHHRLLDMGLDHYQAVFVIYIVQALLIIAAYYLRNAPDALILLCYALCCAAVIATLTWAPRRSAARAGSTTESAENGILPSGERVTRWGVIAVAFSMPLYLGIGALFSAAPSVDIVWLAMVLMAVLILFWWRRGRSIGWLERSGIYLAGALSLYLAQRSGLGGGWTILSNTYFALLAVTVVVAFRCSPDHRFVATPLDFLVVFLAVVFPQVPGLEVGYAQDLTRLMVLFYAIELVLARLSARDDWVRAVACGLLCVPLVRYLV
jgi:UDP-GlcNAc:undecaprenyl-phosphate GlcNAc-1-phosphate transferase